MNDSKKKVPFLSVNILTVLAVIAFVAMIANFVLIYNTLEKDGRQLAETYMTEVQDKLLLMQYELNNESVLDASTENGRQELDVIIRQYSDVLQGYLMDNTIILDKDGNVLVLPTKSSRNYSCILTTLNRATEMIAKRQTYDVISFMGDSYLVYVDNAWEMDDIYLVVFERYETLEYAYFMVGMQLVVGSILVFLTLFYMFKLQLKSREAERSALSEQNFLMNMSHSIRTPLNSMMGYMRMLLKEPISQEAKKYVDEIDNIIMRMSASFSRLQKLEEIPVEKLDLYVKSGGDYRAKVMVVDDNEQNLYIMQELLKGYGLHIELAESGAKALEILEKDALLNNTNIYAVVFMDYMMPEMNGVEATHAIHEMLDGMYENLPIIALTANAFDGISEQFRKEGMYMTITKPIDVDLLDEAMSAFVPARVLMAYKERRAAYRVGISSDAKQQLTEGGINVDSALEHMGGDVQRFQKVLRVFCLHGEERIRQLNNFLKEEDFDNYTISIHGMKSNAYTIGAGYLGDLGAELEKLSAQHSITILEMRQKRFETEMRRVIEVCGRYLAGIQTEDKLPVVIHEERMPHKQYAEEKEKLLAFLEAYDKKAAIRKIHDILGYDLSRPQQVALNECLKHLEEYDYEGAISALHNG